LEKKVSLKSCCYSFNSVIYAFSKSQVKGNGRRAETILDRFFEYNEDEDPTVKPDNRSFLQLLSHYGKSKELDAPYRAEYILNRMVSTFKAGRRELAPTTYAIKTVINSYALAKHPDAGCNADRLLSLLKELRDQYGLQKLVLDTTFMNSVLFAWSACGDENAGIRAEAHLTQMEMLSDAGNTDISPDTKSYELVLSAWGKSKSNDKASQALSILRRMQQRTNRTGSILEVDDHAFSLVINACAFSYAESTLENEQAFRIATDALNELIESAKLNPSALSYGWYIQACSRLRLPESLKYASIERAFNLCCSDGLLNDFVLYRLKQATTDQQFAKLINQGFWGQSTTWTVQGIRDRCSIEQLPRKWQSRIQVKPAKRPLTTLQISESWID
jgi:hypothetical protein